MLILLSAAVNELVAFRARMRSRFRDVTGGLRFECYVDGIEENTHICPACTGSQK